MSKRFLRFFNKQIVVLLSLLGFSLASTQCAAQYGAPPSFNRVKGKMVVRSPKNEPLRNIRVIVQNDTYYSDSNGVVRFNFYIFDDGWPGDSQGFRFRFDDVDGKKNGVFLSQDLIFFLKPREDNDLEVKMNEDA